MLMGRKYDTAACFDESRVDTDCMCRPLVTGSKWEPPV